MPNHKRFQADREITFSRPAYDCYACNDTGIVQNSDGLVNEYLPDYDRLPDGRRMTGADCGLICHCTAAYPQMGPDGQLIRGGFRESSGEVRSVSSDMGKRYVGADFPKDAARELHRRRLGSWKATEAEMNRSRVARAGGDDADRPWFIGEMRDQILSMAKANRDAARAADTERLTSIGEILGVKPNDPPPQHGTNSSRAVAARVVHEYDARQESGQLAPTLDDGGLPTGSVHFPDTIDGPVGFRPDWLGDVAK